jgi:hypothetical protein
MRLLYRRGYVVDEKDHPKLSPQEPSSSLSASGLPASDRSLERVLGAIDKTIRSFESVIQMVYTEVTSQGKLNMARHEMAMKLLGKMRVELATLADQLRDLLTSNDIQLGATITARDALVRTREKIEEAAKDITDSHELMRAENEEGDAPKWSHRALNFVWPAAVRTGKAAAVWGLKLLAGSTVLGGIAKIIHDLLASVH